MIVWVGIIEEYGLEMFGIEEIWYTREYGLQEMGNAGFNGSQTLLGFADAKGINSGCVDIGKLHALGLFGNQFGNTEFWVRFG